MARSMSFFNLRDALAQPGCAVCRLKADAADSFLGSLLWESVNDRVIREDIRQARGFCHEHAWTLADKGASMSLGAAIISRDLLINVLRGLEGARFRKSSGLSLRRRNPDGNGANAALAARIRPQAECPVCVQAHKMEEIYIDILIDELLDGEGLLLAWQGSDGLCLPHLGRALEKVGEEAVFNALVDNQRVIWERLVAQLEETIRKSDHRYRNEAPGEESGSWLRALIALSGARHPPKKF